MTDPGTSGGLAVVTGASSGIGRALAKQFAAHSYDAIISAEDVQIEDAAAELRGLGVTATPVRADLATYQGVEELYAAVRDAARPVDALALSRHRHRQRPAQQRPHPRSPPPPPASD